MGSGGGSRFLEMCRAPNSVWFGNTEMSDRTCMSCLRVNNDEDVKTAVIYVTVDDNEVAVCCGDATSFITMMSQTHGATWAAAICKGSSIFKHPGKDIRRMSVTEAQHSIFLWRQQGLVQ